MSNQQQRYSGLRALAAKLGMGASTAGLAANGAGPAADDDTEGQGEGEGEGEGTQPKQTPAAPGEGEGEGGGDGEGEGDGDGDDTGDGDGDSDTGGAGEGEGEGGGATLSADYRRGFSAGGQATAGRWAATFLNESCRANLELATDLLADTDMTPDKIAAYCGRNPGGKAGLNTLATTPKPRVGLESGGKDGNGLGEVDEAAQARQTANSRQNGRVKGAAGSRPVRRAGGPGGTIKKNAAAGGEK